MRRLRIFALLVGVVLVSSGFRTAFGQEATEVEEVKEEETSESDETSVEAASGAQEVSGNLKADSDVQRRVELAESAEDGALEADEKDTDVEDVPYKPEPNPAADRTRSGNLDAYYGKRN
jgi:hypothetical protein